MRAEGAYFCDPQQTEALRHTVFNPDHSLNVKVVGKSTEFVAEVAGFRIPTGTRILVTPLTKIGREEPLSHEKMTTVLAWYVADGWEQGCEMSITTIEAGGLGHTQIIYANDEKVIMAFGMEKPVFRILVNTMGTLGAIGLTTGVMPSLTLGPGGLGGAITSDNITAYHLVNVKRLAYELTPPPSAALSGGETISAPSADEIERVVRQVVSEILGSK